MKLDARDIKGKRKMPNPDTVVTIYYLFTVLAMPAVIWGVIPPHMVPMLVATHSIGFWMFLVWYSRIYYKKER